MAITFYAVFFIQPEVNKSIAFQVGVKRIAKAAELLLQAELLTEHMEVYISFVAENRKVISNNTYLGSFLKRKYTFCEAA